MIALVADGSIRLASRAAAVSAHRFASCLTPVGAARETALCTVRARREIGCVINPICAVPTIPTTHQVLPRDLAPPRPRPPLPDDPRRPLPRPGRRAGLAARNRPVARRRPDLQHAGRGRPPAGAAGGAPPRGVLGQVDVRGGRAGRPAARAAVGAAEGRAMGRVDGGERGGGGASGAADVGAREWVPVVSWVG